MLRERFDDPRNGLRHQSVQATSLLKNCEATVHTELQNRHSRRNDPEHDKGQPGHMQVSRPIRFMMMNQGHDFLPRGL